jgi:hypothetical protein
MNGGPQPCSWPIDRTCLPALPDPSSDGYAAALAQQLSMEDIAVNVLWALTGRQFGVCQTTIRPCADAHQPIDWLERMGTFYGGYSHVVIEGLADFLGCGCTGRCLLSGPSAVHLPGPVYPPDDTHSVTVTFTMDENETRVLDDDEFSIEGDVLFRTGGAPWPYQDYSRPMGEDGTWSVQYWRGTPPPAGAATFVGVLAKEFLAAACGSSNCRLPKTVTRVSRQGVSYDIDPTVIYANGKTGVSEVDSWLAVVNPNHLMQAPSVM